MSDRLSELQRQRALIQGHLAWLDQEIADAAGKSPTPSPTPLASPTPAPQPSVPATGATDEIADELIAKFGDDSKNAAQSARKGCFMIFGLVFVLLGLGLYGIHLYSRHQQAKQTAPADQPGLAAPAKR